MKREDVLDLIRNGEDSGVEFKRDDVTNYDLAKEIVSFLNVAGGVVLLGVEDDGTISGTTKDRLDEWVAELARRKIEPPVIPFLSWAKDVEPGKHVLAARVPVGPDKPYARVHDNRRTYFVRVGSTCREASREELERMFQASGRLQYGLKPVPGASLADLDLRRLRDYLVRILAGSAPEDDDQDGWERLLTSLDLMTPAAGVNTPAIDGVLLFGKNPKRFLPQSGIRALSYPGTTPDYATRADQDLKGPLVPLGAADGSLVEIGLVEQALDFVRRNTEPRAFLDGGRRIDRTEYPEAVIREAVVNALVHRDYSLSGSDITLAIFSDRLEILSPGRLPNTVTVEGMKAGLRYARNQNLVNILRDYRYVDFRGMGVREKIIPGMREHNGTEPELLAEDSRFIVRLWKERPVG
ncbi:MAG TPA: ATP-binding protein [Thermoanaerobaculia bacterium]|jgi:ATP-dependent DNA helicase RecG|nr:ATP-binding protein [Thermoanaerobaculia bacterium]